MLMGAASNGDIYYPTAIDSQLLSEMKKAGSLLPVSRFHAVIQVFSRDGRRKCVSALPGFGGGRIGSPLMVRVGRSGALYVPFMGRLAGQEVPEGIDPADKNWRAPDTSSTWGAVVKFRSSLDAFPAGRFIGGWGETTPENPTHMIGRQPVRAENMHWDYGGYSPLSLFACTCHGSTFNLDRFDRLFVPAAQTFTVSVLDANGNMIARIGGYGNCDSRGKGSPVADPNTGALRPRQLGDPRDLTSPLAAPEIAFANPNYVAASDEALYVHDGRNQRIVRAKVKYAAEEQAPVP
jgi:hypothetical protein